MPRGDGNRDHVWFTRAEARGFLPDRVEVGQRGTVARNLLDRIVRLHLIDTVRGQTDHYPPEAVSAAHLATTVVGIEGRAVRLKLEGSSLAEQRGLWSIRGLEDATPTPQERGCRARWLGDATFDLTRERFVALELTVLASRWGATRFNHRTHELGPAPQGFVFRLAGNDPADRTPPGFIWEYGWPTR